MNELIHFQLFPQWSNCIHLNLTNYKQFSLTPFTIPSKMVPEKAWRYTRGISPWCPPAECWKGLDSVCSNTHPFHLQTSAHPPNSPPRPQQQGLRSDPWVNNEYINIMYINLIKKQTVCMFSIYLLCYMYFKSHISEIFAGLFYFTNFHYCSN